MYKYELHRHTSDTSPCAQSPGATVPHDAKAQGFTGVCITDHFWDGFIDNVSGNWDNKVEAFMRGYNLAAEEGSKIGIDVIFGAEMQFCDNASHHIVFGMDEGFLKAVGDLTRISLQAFSIIARSEGFFLYQTHPFRSGSHRSVYRPEDPSILDGVEVYNSRTNDEDNLKALTYARENNLILLSGSDAHAPDEPMPSGLLFHRRIKDGADMARALHAEEAVTFIWKGRQLSFNNLKSGRID